MVNFYVFRDADGLYLLDAGFVGGRLALRRALRSHGWDRIPIRGIIATHGHIDHILNIGLLARETGAWIAASKLDAGHYLGHPNYPRRNRPLGWFDAFFRRFLPFVPFTPYRWLEEGDHLEIWDGLKTIHLPGHTMGHLGFFCEQRGLLFSADLFASHAGLGYLPPWLANADPKEIPKSIAKALRLPAKGVLPHHGDHAEPEEHLRRLRKLQERVV